MARIQLRHIAALLGTAVLGLATACSSSGGGSGTPSSSSTTLPSVTFAGVAPNAGNWAIQVCSDAGIGICEKYGVHVKMIYSGTSPAALSALYSGSVQYTSALFSAAIPAYLQNSDLVYVASGYDFFPYELVTPTSITSPLQLKGRTCGTQVAANVADGPFLQDLISDSTNGAVSYPGDYKVVPDSGIETVSGAVAAYKSGGVACSAQLPPVSGELGKLGYHTLVSGANLKTFQGLPFFGLNSTKKWLTANSSTNIKFLEGYLASIAWLENPANKQAALQLLAKDASVTTDVAESAYAFVTDGGYPRQGTVPSQAIPNNLAVSQKYGGTDKSITAAQLSGMVDNSYVQKAYAALPENVKCEQYVESAVPASKKPTCSKLYSDAS